MSTLSDVQTLYGSVRDIWTKSQAHIISHAVLALSIFIICGATVPEMSIPNLQAKQIADNEWFKLAKDTGLVYVTFAIPIVIVATYGAILNWIGQIIVTMVMTIFPPLNRSEGLHLLSAPILEPLALSLGKKDFNLNDLVSKSNELALKYSLRKSENWEAFQRSIGKLTKNSIVYLGDFLMFSLVWIVLFHIRPQQSWVLANRSLFWPVLTIIFGLAWSAGFRVSRVMAIMPKLLLVSVSLMLRADPDIVPLLEVDDIERNVVRERLEKLLKEEREALDMHPSLLRLIAYRFGFTGYQKKKKKSKERQGFPFYTFYERGLCFSTGNLPQGEKLDNRLLYNSLAYFYFRIHNSLSALARVFWQLIRGTP